MSHLKDYAVLSQHVAHLHDGERDPEVGVYEKEQLDVLSETQQNAAPSICGMPLKYVS